MGGVIMIDKNKNGEYSIDCQIDIEGIDPDKINYSVGGKPLNLESPKKAEAKISSFLKTVEIRPIYRQALNGYLAIIEYLEEQILEATGMIRVLLKPDARVKLLKTIPGICELTAYLLLAEIGEASRFPAAKKLCSYAGITPAVRESAEHRWAGRITRQGNRYIRWSIVEAG